MKLILAFLAFLIACVAFYFGTATGMQIPALPVPSYNLPSSSIFVLCVLI